MKLECGQVWRTNYGECLLLKRVEENDPRDSFQGDPISYDCYELWEVFVIDSKYFIASRVTNALIHPNAHERIA